MIASDSYFTFQNPRATNRPKEYHSYQDLHILSCYYDKDKPDETSDSVTRQPQDHDVRPRTPSDDGTDSRSVSTIDTPVTPEEQIYRISTLQSDESGWLANETSVTQREKKFKARCFQVVQQAPTEKSKDGDVTVVRIAGPGKPKLVEISRPTSISTISTSHGKSMVERPQTPTQVKEVSAFSPWDTPFTHIDQETPASVTPARPRLHISVPNDNKHRFSTSSLVPAPLMPRASSGTPDSDRSSSTVFSSTQEKLAALSDPFGMSPQSQRTESVFNSSTATISTSAWPVPPRNVLRRLRHHNRSPAISHPSPNFDSPPLAQQEACCSGAVPPSASGTPTHRYLTGLSTRLSQVRHTLASITAAINAFPNNILRLDSAILSPLRNPHILDQTYTEALGKIFPRGRPVLLSALAAWLIIDLWFEKNIDAAPKEVRDEQLSAEDVLRSRLGEGFWNDGGREPYHTLDDADMSPQLHESSPHTGSSASPNTVLPALPTPRTLHFNAFSSTSASDLAWSRALHLNSPLKRIPTKARSLLGISHSTTQHGPFQDAQFLRAQEASLRKQEADLTKKLRMVRPAANVLTQKLVVALRGEWDEDVWMCLRVMVGVVEGSFGWSAPTTEESGCSAGDFRRGYSSGVAGPGPAVATQSDDVPYFSLQYFSSPGIAFVMKLAKYIPPVKQA
ncbi:uncharacterized protein AB675_8415 [Cyphellophora attinorum]|uniref:Uncharacterized protein n=1 Tax=Cyphellophora attinorum TaxID=1664694 RepID=A0A0N1HFY4_9EURO|nr:uncharacterized protein AB675_8415 [Phialophora attinorum]KPI44366.1 hypothetical protein AB675_8415 [Phialophora attinorum]